MRGVRTEIKKKKKIKEEKLETEKILFNLIFSDDCNGNLGSVDILVTSLWTLIIVVQYSRKHCDVNIYVQSANLDLW